MVAYAKERYSGMSLTGMQSSWYPGGNAESAQELSGVISQVHCSVTYVLCAFASQFSLTLWW